MCAPVQALTEAMRLARETAPELAANLQSNDTDIMFQIILAHLDADRAEVRAQMERKIAGAERTAQSGSPTDR